MNTEIEKYNGIHSPEEKEICDALMHMISEVLTESSSKVWHGHPVWFLDGNPIVGYAKLKNGIQLLFWSGQSFEEEGLKPEGKFKAAEVRYSKIGDLDAVAIKRWLEKSIRIQWDYKNIVKRGGELLRLT